MLEAQQLSYTRDGSRLLAPLSFTLAAGEWLTIAGHNGSGKSTLLRLLLGLEPPSTGEILWEGRPAASAWKAIRPQFGVVLQHPEDQILSQTVLGEVAMGLPTKVHALPSWQEERQQILTHFGLWAKREMNPCDLSGGEKSLLALASALLRQPRLLVLDEPFASLDYWAIRLALQALLAIRQKKRTAIVLVAHQLDAFLAHSDRLLLLAKGKLQCDAPPAAALAWAEQSGVRTPAVAVAECSWL